MLNSIYSFKFTFSTITNNNEVQVKFALKGRVVAPWAWHQTCDQKVVGSTQSADHSGTADRFPWLSTTRKRGI